MTDQSNTMHNHRLIGPDADAVDALVEAQFDLSRVPEEQRARAEHAAALFSLAGGPQVEVSRTLTDVTMARLIRLADDDVGATLSPEDAEALDALVAADFRVGKVPGALRARAERIDAMAQLVADAGPEDARPLLVERTMRRIATARRSGPSERAVRSGGLRFADLVSVAAVLLMGVAVMWPVLSTVRGYSQKADCASNFGGIASALSSYMGDFRDQMPVATASFGGSWLNVGSTPEQSNSSNLFTMARAGYTRLDTLACAGNPMAARGECAQGAMDWRSLPEVSYSYYIMFGPARPNPVTSPRTIVLADRSPVALRAANGQGIPFPEENSPNHAGQGQWGLRLDGSAVWLTSPQDGRDNLWLNADQQAVWDTFVKPHLPRIRQMYPNGKVVIEVSGVRRPLMQGDELPASESDSFLGP
jgi:hypothetical protein